MLKFPYLASLCWLLFFLLGCAPSERELQKDLDSVASSDLEDIVQDMRERNIDSLLSQNPYYVVDTIITFQGHTARQYAGIATVKFYYLKRLKFHQVRKYRYLTTAGFWERYEIKLKHTFASPDSLKKTPRE